MSKDEEYTQNYLSNRHNDDLITMHNRALMKLEYMQKRIKSIEAEFEARGIHRGISSFEELTQNHAGKKCNHKRKNRFA